MVLSRNEIAEKERSPMVEVKEYLEGNKTF